MLDLSSEFVNIEPGKVMSVENVHLTIKTGSSLIKVIGHEFESILNGGDYL